MTLFRKASLVATLLCFFAIVGTAAVTWINFRSYVSEQLYLGAQDTAVSLSLTVVDAAQREDIAQITQLLEQVFHQGNYRAIKLLSNDESLLFEKRVEAGVEGVPDWFVRFAALEPAIGYSDVFVNWQPMMRIEVERHRGRAYADLWALCWRCGYWVIFWGTLCTGVALLVVRKHLKPLRFMEKQALSMATVDPMVALSIPKTREFQRIVQVMNRMAGNLAGLFEEQISLVEQVRARLHLDAVTGLGNKRYFESRFFALAESDGVLYGSLVQMVLQDFSQYNKRFGRVAGDLLLKQAAGRWQKILDEIPNSISAKWGGGEFIAWLPNVDQEEADYYLVSLYSSIVELPVFQQSDKQNAIHIGMAWGNYGVSVDALLSSTREAVRMAQGKLCNGVHLKVLSAEGRQCPSEYQALGSLAWQDVIRNRSNEARIELQTQPILNLQKRSTTCHEVLPALSFKRSLIPENVYMPLLERDVLSFECEQWLLQQIMSFLNACTGNDDRFIIKLSPSSLQIEGFVEWILDQIRSTPHLAKHLIFEVPESCLSFLLAKIQTLATGLSALGAGVSLGQFGVGWKGFDYLSTLPLYSIRLDYSYIRGLQESHDYQFFVKTVSRIAHSRGILVFANHVCSEAEWDILKTLGVDGCQGDYLVPPCSMVAKRLRLYDLIVDNSYLPIRVKSRAAALS